MQSAYSFYYYVLDVMSSPDLPSPSIMTYWTLWELARGIRPSLTLDASEFLRGFFGWCVSI